MQSRLCNILHQEKYCEYGVHQVGLCLSQRHRAKSSHAQHLEQRQTKEPARVSAVYKWTGLKSQNPKQQYEVREIREKGRKPMMQNSPKNA